MSNYKKILLDLAKINLSSKLHNLEEKQTNALIKLKRGKEKKPSKGEEALRRKVASLEKREEIEEGVKRRERIAAALAKQEKRDRFISTKDPETSSLALARSARIRANTYSKLANQEDKRNKRIKGIESYGGNNPTPIFQHISPELKKHTKERVQRAEQGSGESIKNLEKQSSRLKRLHGAAAKRNKETAQSYNYVKGEKQTFFPFDRK